MKLALLALCIVAFLEIIEADQRRGLAKVTKGFEQCRKARSRRQENWGTSELKEARVYQNDGTTELELEEKDGYKVFKFVIGRSYKFRFSFEALRYPQGFGALPKYFGVKISEEYVQAPRGSQQIFEASYGKPLIGKQDCSPVLLGARGKDADGCQWLTKNSQGSCPLNKNPEDIREVEFSFVVPNFPEVITNSSFRLIPTETEVKRGGCELIGRPGGTETTIDTDMICFKYPTYIARG